MIDGAEKSEPSASNTSTDSGANDSVPNRAFLDEEGPGIVAIGLSWSESRIRNLDSDKTIPREERDLLRLYFTREREKFRWKLRMFGETEKIKALESEIRSDDEVQKAGSNCSLAEESLAKARSELQKASTALELISRDDANWEKHKASARTWEKSREWQAITPDELQPAVEAIRHRVEHYGFWQSAQSTMKLGYAALHLAHAAGSTLYDQATAWTREELIRTEELLEARSTRLIDFLRLHLDQLARAAHIDFVKTNTAKSHAVPLGQVVRQATPLPTIPPVGQTLAADVWRGLHDRFKTLAEEEVTLAPQNSGDRWLRAYVDYKDKSKAVGQWNLSESIHENFRERFEVEATRAGIALGWRQTRRVVGTSVEAR
jgi:hypothetical protein